MLRAEEVQVYPMGEDSKPHPPMERAFRPPLYSNHIDFDEASKAWMANKRKVPGGYVYACMKKFGPYNCTAAVLPGKNCCAAHRDCVQLKELEE